MNASASPIAARPAYVLESREDEVYHDHKLGARAVEPEYCGWLDQSWVFNRAVEWIRPDNGTLLCVAHGGDLPLTGAAQVSRWFSDPVNGLEDEGDTLRFRKRSARRRDGATLPALQFNVEQHPVAELAVAQATHDWQGAVFVKGRSGPPLLHSGWCSGAQTLRFDVRAALAERGYTLHWHELFFVVGVWCAIESDAAEVTFALRLKAAPAVVPCLPVVRTGRNAEGGVPLSAVVVDASGQRMTAAAGHLTASLGGKRYALSEREGVWSGLLPRIPEGDHRVLLAAEGAVSAHTHLPVRVTSGAFYAYDADLGTLVKDGAPTGPLSGSYQGLAFFADAGRAGERMVNGQAAYEAWDRAQPPGEHWHYWEALTEAELEQRFGYLRACGWNLLHLCQHWGTWEKFDAGGRLAPHAAEQAALYYRVAGRHGLAVCQALSHYPYAVGEGNKTRPWQRYVDAGYRDADWADPDSRPFTDLFQQYLADYAALFRDEPALFCMTTSGEGDHETHAPRVNAVHRFVSGLDKNHVFLSEPIFRLDRPPRQMAAGWNQPLFGSRLYWIAETIEPETDLSIEYKFMQTAPVYVGEGSWPCPRRYADFTGLAYTWVGTDLYRLRVRDTLYLGLVHRIPVILTWEEQLTEDERRVFDTVRRMVDWAQPWREPPVAIRVDERNMTGAGRETLAAWERILAAWPLMTRYCFPDEAAPADAALMLNGCDPLGADAAAGALSDARRAEWATWSPVRLSAGYRAGYAWSADRRTLLVYLANSGGHVEQPMHLGGRLHRAPASAACGVRLRNLPEEALTCRIYDLNTKREVRTQAVRGQADFSLGDTTHDFLVLVRP